jgi:hypothetical protein
MEAIRREAKREKLARRKIGASGRLAAAFLESKLTPLLVVASLFVGAVALDGHAARRRAADQGADGRRHGRPARCVAQEVERRVITRLRRCSTKSKMWSTSIRRQQPSGGMIIVRFYVGTDPDQAVDAHSRETCRKSRQFLPARFDAMPPLVKPRTIDDVPAIAYTIWSTKRLPPSLRRVADEIRTESFRHPRVAQAWLIGGQRRVVTRHVRSRQTCGLPQHRSAAGLRRPSSANWKLARRQMTSDDHTTEVHVGGFVKTLMMCAIWSLQRTTASPSTCAMWQTLSTAPKSPRNMCGWAAALRRRKKEFLSPGWMLPQSPGHRQETGHQRGRTCARTRRAL